MSFLGAECTRAAFPILAEVAELGEWLCRLLGFDLLLKDLQALEETLIDITISTSSARLRARRSTLWTITQSMSPRLSRSSIARSAGRFAAVSKINVLLEWEGSFLGTGWVTTLAEFARL